MSTKVTSLGNGMYFVQSDPLNSALLNETAVAGMFDKQATAAQASLGLDSGGWVDVVMQREAGDLTTSVAYNKDMLLAFIDAANKGNVKIVYIGPHGSYQNPA